MARTNCPNCGKTNVKGKRSNSSVPGMTMTGGLAGLYLGPAGPIIGVPAGYGLGKIIDLMGKKEFKYTCPRCGYTWNENE